MFDRRIPFHRNLNGRLLAALVLVALLSAAGISVVAFNRARDALEARVTAQLTSVADLKKEQIVVWIDERRADARSLAVNRLNQQHLTEILSPDVLPERKAEFAAFTVENLVALQQARRGYSQIVFADVDGTVVLSTDPGLLGQPIFHEVAFAETLAAPDGAFMEDIHFEPGNSLIEMDFGHVVHAVDLESGEETEVIIGAVIISVDMEETIYSVIRAWPGMGATGETLLVRAEGDSTLFLNNLRFAEDAALNLRVPVDSPDAQPAHLAARGAEGVIETPDYRGVPVLAAYRHIPGINWGFVAKEDVAEAFAPVNDLARQVILLTAGVLLGAGLLSVLLARTLTRPLAQLVRVSGAVAAGNLEADIDTTRRDEIGALAVSFREMVAALRRRQEQLRVADDAALTIAGSLTLDEVLQRIVDAARELCGARYAALDARDHSGQITSLITSGLTPEEYAAIGPPPTRHGVLGLLWEQRAPWRMEDLNAHPASGSRPAGHPEVKSFLGVPILGREQALGTLYMTGKIGAEAFSQADEDLLVRLATHAAVAVENAQLFDRVRRQAAQLGVVVEISHDLSGILDFDTLLRSVSERIMSTFGYYHVNVALVEGDEVVFWHGHTGATAGGPLKEYRLKIGAEGLTGWAATQRRTVYVSDVTQDPRYFATPELPDIRSELIVPLIAHGDLVGLLDVQSSAVDAFDEADEVLLEALAGSLAVAIRNARLFADLDASYDHTLDALVAALDARDKETEGHTQRVVAYTLALARQLQVLESEQTMLRRGALLHDIGKIGVPDAILRKPGPLDDDEWDIMRRHPEWGERILSGIDYLQAAVEIVCAHHERWDGNGYPYNLQGEDIPIGARVFAVADAFDAMTSDRPYRAAQPYAVARAEIEAGSGTQFDPRVVTAFLQIPEAEWLRLRAVAQAASALPLMEILADSNALPPELGALSSMIGSVSSSLELSDVLHEATRAVVERLGAASSGLFLYDPESDTLALAADHNLPPALKARFDQIPVLGFHNERVVREGKMRLLGDAAHVTAFAELGLPETHPELGQYLCVPLLNRGQVNGVLGVFCRRPHTFDENLLRLYKTLGEHIGLAIAHARLHESVQKMAITDSLTGAYNRRFLDDFLGQELQRCGRYGRSVALIMLDIDCFKDYNDTYGHLAGDEALLQLVALLRESVRAVDLVARYGGEEFVIVLPEADQRGAQITAEKIRAAIAAHDFPRGRLTASLGVAQCSDVVGAKMTPEKLIAGADKALFKAKEAGRNRVVVMHD